MKIMAVDYGDARTGLAMCDRTETLASPVGVIAEKSMAAAAEKIVYAAREFEAGMIVIGLPVNMDGTEGPRAKKSRRLGAMLGRIAGLPVDYWDERNTTRGAAALLSEAGAFGGRRKRVLDAVAAVVLLESYIARRRNAAGPREHSEE